MIEIEVTGIKSDDDVALVTDNLQSLDSIHEIMVTLKSNGETLIIVTGETSDEKLTEAVTTAGPFTVTAIQREGIDPYKTDN